MQDGKEWVVFIQETGFLQNHRTSIQNNHAVFVGIQNH